MNILLKALRFQIFSLRLLRMIRKDKGSWWISYQDFCTLDKWTKGEILENGIQVTKAAYAA